MPPSNLAQAHAHKRGVRHQGSVQGLRGQYGLDHFCTWTLTERTRHIHRLDSFVRELVRSGDIEIEYIKSEDNLADFFTEILPLGTCRKQWWANEVGWWKCRNVGLT